MVWYGTFRKEKGRKRKGEGEKRKGRRLRQTDERYAPPIA
jgi:hypothetical protein